MGSTDESFSNTGYEPKDYFLTETYVESLTESMTEQRFPEQRFLEDMDHDDAAIGETLFNAYREQVYHSQREGLSVGQSSSSVSDRSGQPVVEIVAKKKSHDRSGQPVVERGQELNTEHAQIRTLLDRQREQILADCQAEIRRHELQAYYDRRRLQKLRETIESLQEELHRAQAEKLHRRDQQLVHEGLLKQNWDLRDAHKKSLKEMEELKKFQSSTFDTIARYRICKMKLIVSMTQEISKMLNQYAVDIPTLPVNQCLSHLIQFMVECQAVQ